MAQALRIQMRYSFQQIQREEVHNQKNIDDESVVSEVVKDVNKGVDDNKFKYDIELHNTEASYNLRNPRDNVSERLIFENRHTGNTIPLGDILKTTETWPVDALRNIITKVTKFHDTNNNNKRNDWYLHDDQHMEASSQRRQEMISDLKDQLEVQITKARNLWATNIVASAIDQITRRAVENGLAWADEGRALQSVDHLMNQILDSVSPDYKLLKDQMKKAIYAGVTSNIGMLPLEVQASIYSGQMVTGAHNLLHSQLEALNQQWGHAGTARNGAPQRGRSCGVERLISGASGAAAASFLASCTCSNTKHLNCRILRK